MLQRQPSPGAPADVVTRGPSSRIAILALAIAIVLVARTWMAANFGLTDDEAYYRLWSLAPALSYYDHPPMVAYCIAAGRSLVGDTELGIRAALLVAFVIGTAAIWRAAKLLFGEAVAITSTWMALAMPLLGAGGIVITPDAPTVLSWALVVWAIAELLRSQNANWWLAVGAFAGLGLLSKYTNLFIGAGLVLWLVVARDQLRWFARWQLWAGGVIAVACAAPVVIWNAQHEWASFAKQFGRVAKGQHVTASYLLEMAGGTIALVSPLIAILAIVGLVAIASRVRRHREPAETLILALIAPALVYFTAHALHSRVQANWLAPLYPLLAMCAAYAIHHVISSTWRRVTVAAAAALGFGMTALLYVHAIAPLDGGRLKKDPTDQARGWRAFADEVDRHRRAVGASWIATSSYATTGQLAFALRDRAPVHQLNDRIRYAHLPPFDPRSAGTPVLYVELARRAAPSLLETIGTEPLALPVLSRQTGSGRSENYVVYTVR